MKIMLVAAEPSADLHAGRLVKELKKLSRSLPESLDIYGVGGANVKAAGGEVIYDLASLSTYGIVEVFSSAPALLKTFFGLLLSIRRERPDAVVLMDYPDFNIKLARFIRWFYGRSIKIIYYICPQVWIWRKKRVKTIAKLFDKVLAVFPVEEGLYSKAGVEVEFVGHPLAESIYEKPYSRDIRKRFGIKENDRLIALLPGSRTKELSTYMPVFVEAVEMLNKRDENYRFIVALAPNLQREALEEYINSGSETDIEVAHGETLEAVMASDAVLVALGTATLETALLGKPMIMVGKVSLFTKWVGLYIYRFNEPFYGLANWVLGRKAFPELIQDDFTAERIVEEIESMFSDTGTCEKLIESAKETKTLLGDRGASANSAQAIFRCIMEKEWNTQKKKSAE